MFRFPFLAGTALAASLLVLGCGGDGKKTVRVKVQKDGAGLSGVALVLFANGAQAGDGLTGADGIATIKAPPGDYKVTASKKPKLSENGIIDPKDMMKMTGGPKGPGPMGMPKLPKEDKGEELADEFTKVDKTPLTLKIPADKDPAELTVKGK